MCYTTHNNELSNVVPFKNQLMKQFFISLTLLLIVIASFAQNKYPFQLTLEPAFMNGFAGLQSYAWAQDGDLLLLIGGRKDGLHRRQPFAAFNKQFNNTDLIVIDFKNEKVWSKSVVDLPASIAEQLQSTNMQFYQQANQLVLIGGYGYSETAKNHITYPALIIIQVKELINAITKNNNTSSFINQLNDDRMAVTGGRLNQLNNTYFLVGGQRFTGRYNPMGPDHGPGFTQEYTNQIRQFQLKKNENSISIKNYKAITDSSFHRRDYNLLMQLDKEGKEMLTIFSGVFQYKKDVPFTTLIDIKKDIFNEVEGFNQQFSHYHTATLPIYSKKSKTMFSIFFGGIAQYYKNDQEEIVKDDNVPFVKSISVIERNKTTIKEYLLPEPMPGYFGAASEFIPAKSFITDNGMLQLDEMPNTKTLIGYIVGGIDSRAPNVFWSNEGDPSRASPVIWKVYITK